MNKPLVKILFYYIIGIIIGIYLDISLFLNLWIYFLGLFFFIISYFKIKHLKNLFLILILIFSGFLIYEINTHYYFSKSHITNLALNKKYTIQAIVISDPEISNKKTVLTLNIEKIIFPRIEFVYNGKIRVYIKNSFYNYQYGDKLFFTGKIHSLEKLNNQKQLGFKKMLITNKICGLMYLKGDYFIKKFEEKKRNWFVNMNLQIKRWLEQKIEKTTNFASSNLLKGFILGTREKIDPEIEEFFLKSGTLHILAVSGMHVNLCLGFIFLFLNLIKIPKKFNYLLCILFLFFFAIITGYRGSVLRSSIMAAFFLIAKLLDKDTDMFNILATSGFFILIINPCFLFDIGFQLSFVAIIFLFYSIPILQFIKKENVKQISKIHLYLIKTKEYFFQIFISSVCVSIGLLPLGIYYFKTIYTYGIFTNLLAIPLSTISLQLGLLTFITFSPIDKILGFLNEIILFFLIKVVSFFSKLPFSTIEISNFPIYFLLLSYCLIFCLFNINKLFLILKKGEK